MGAQPINAITVTILPLESATEQSGGSGGEHCRDESSRIKALRQRRLSTSAPAIPRRPRTAVAQENILPRNLSSVAATGVTAIAEVSTDGIPTRTGESYGKRQRKRRKQFWQQKELAPGMGNGSGNGQGIGNGTSWSGATQARYRETPQPHYPDSARREGKEGRVLLRVLVDEEGKTKAIEVNTSSGHDLLDRAATEAIKKWRFVPARAGGKPIETWVKVPIEFQLSNAKP